MGGISHLTSQPFMTNTMIYILWMILLPRKQCGHLLRIYQGIKLPSRMVLLVGFMFLAGQSSNLMYCWSYRLYCRDISHPPAQKG
uniref:Uncharacterized protein n=1 Tax=Arundo donax TaxID=35708 RepID=A0A0A8YUB9_ARUDO